MKIESEAFEPGLAIPPRYACDGENVNPPLKFSNIPQEAKSLALVVDDPDAPNGTFIHWLIWNIPTDTSEIGEKTDSQSMVTGLNGFGKVNYGGPCPPKGEEHRYFFKLYALNAILDLKQGTVYDALKQKINDHIVSEAVLMGTYKRKE